VVEEMNSHFSQSHSIVCVKADIKFSIHISQMRHFNVTEIETFTTSMLRHLMLQLETLICSEQMSGIKQII